MRGSTTSKPIAPLLAMNEASIHDLGDATLKKIAV